MALRIWKYAKYFDQVKWLWRTTTYTLTTNLHKFHANKPKDRYLEQLATVCLARVVVFFALMFQENTADMCNTYIRHSLTAKDKRKIFTVLTFWFDSFHSCTLKFSDNDDGFLSNVPILPVMCANYKKCTPHSSKQFRIDRTSHKTSLVKESQFKFSPAKESQTI